MPRRRDTARRAAVENAPPVRAPGVPTRAPRNPGWRAARRARAAATRAPRLAPAAGPRRFRACSARGRVRRPARRR